MLPFPLQFSGVRIDGPQRTGERLGIVVRKVGTAVESMPRFVWLRRRAEDVTLLPRRYIEEPRLRIVSRRHPVRCSGRTRAHAIPFQSRRGILSRNGSSAYVLRVAPCLLRERVREHDLSIGAINQIKEPVAVRLHDQVLVALIDHDGHLGGVVVMLIMRSEEHTSELQSQSNLVCRLLLEKKKKKKEKIVI